MSDARPGGDGAVTSSEAIALLSRVFLIIAIAFGTALVTCLSALPNSVGKPELIDLYVMVLRFSLSGLIGAFLWYVPLVIRLRIEGRTPWRRALRWGLSGVSIVGVFVLVTVFVRIVTNGIELIGPIATRYGTAA